jgi:hypothetical protein
MARMRIWTLRITRVVAMVGVMGIAGAAFLQQGSLLIRQAGGGIQLAHAVPLAQDNDNGSNDNNDENGNDENGFSEISPAPPSGPAFLPPLPTTEAIGTSTGGDSSIALGENRVVLQIFPWMPAGVTIRMQAVDPATVAAVPGNRVGNLMFRIDAQDAAGQTLGTLPAEVNLSVRYSNEEIGTLNESNVTLSQLSPTDNRWRVAPKLVREPTNNYVAASIVELGIYAVHVP